jgi:hypothetical protein
MGTKLNPQLFVKSVGYGVMIAEITPPPEKEITTNGNQAGYTRLLGHLIKKSGLPVQEVLTDPVDTSKAVVLLTEGLPPVAQEKNQTETNDWEMLERVLEVTGNPRLAQRISFLRDGMPVSMVD